MLESKSFSYYTCVEYVPITEEEYHNTDKVMVYLKKDEDVYSFSKEYYEYLKNNNMDDGLEVIKYCEEVFHDPSSIKTIDKALNNENVSKIFLRNSQDRNNCVISRGDDGFHCYLYYSKKVPSFGSKFNSNNKVKTINN